MNENIDLVEILKDVPKGTKLWSPIFGDIQFERIDTEDDYYPIVCSTTDNEETFTKEGHIYEAFENTECVLFPSRDQRDWSKFQCEQKQERVVRLHPFDRVLVRDSEQDEWRPDLFWKISNETDTYKYITESCSSRRYLIPYNRETYYLLGTTKQPTINYKILKGRGYKE